MMTIYNFKTLIAVTFAIMAWATLANSATHIGNETHYLERYGECGSDPLPACGPAILDTYEQLRKARAAEEALERAVERRQASARDNEVVVGVMPKGKAVVESDLEFLSTSDYHVSYRAEQFDSSEDCGAGRVWLNTGLKTKTQARGWTDQFSYGTNLIGRTDLRIGGFGPCTMIITFRFSY